ncbi:protein DETOXIFICATION 45, chloroplastic isoform X2 [Ricinus communis]|nr:protein DETOXIFICATION 45, chloroplastic isoform X2 [Ricinus communis]XP_015576360.2 protein DETOXIFICATION 45, chloroplastic isoform X2 [Ricinus communis]XP_048230208.1 protein DETOXIFICATION 45, chloroplastic isoform X2 [Ricinus communis]
MKVGQLTGAQFCGVTGRKCERRAFKKWAKALALEDAINSPQGSNLAMNIGRGLIFNNVIKCCGSISKEETSDYDLNLSSLEGTLISSNRRPLHKGNFDSTGSPLKSESLPQSVQMELIMLSIPAIAGQAIEPLAQLMETAYVGRLGPLELASAGVSMSIFNIISKVFNIPLLSVATSFVAEDISRNANDSGSDGGDSNNIISERKLLPSVSTALLLATGIGLFEALAMYLGSGVFLNMMGISSASPMRVPAEKFLKIRAIGAPAVVLYLAIQGIFRGFKDTKTPVLCLGLGNLSAVFLFPILMHYFRLGVTGAAISTVASQYIVSFLMIWYLNKRTVLSLPSVEGLDFGGYLRSGGFLLGRTLAAVMTITLSTSMAARQGALAMAAHQICLQVWLSVSLLVDAQAASSQALIASSSAKGDYSRVKEITFCSLKLGLFTGISLAIILGVSFSSLATLFTKDAEVLAIVRTGVLFVTASQPINAIAYIFDGLHYGISDFSYAAWSMMAVGALSSVFMLYLPSVVGLSGVWSGLTLFMGLRTVAGYMRLVSKKGPWWFLLDDIN